MGQNLSFQQILRQKVKERNGLNSATTESFTPFPPSDTPAWFFSESLHFDFRPLRGAQIYSKLMPQKKATPTTPKEPRLKYKDLSPALQKAYNKLKAQLKPGQLKTCFSLRELKKAYRSLALKTHPDRHIQAREEERARLKEAFQEIRENYSQLQTAFQDLNL